MKYLKYCLLSSVIVVSCCIQNVMLDDIFLQKIDTVKRLLNKTTLFLAFQKRFYEQKDSTNYFKYFEKGTERKIFEKVYVFNFIDNFYDSIKTYNKNYYFQFRNKKTGHVLLELTDIENVSLIKDDKRWKLQELKETEQKDFEIILVYNFEIRGYKNLKEILVDNFNRKFIFNVADNDSLYLVN